MDDSGYKTCPFCKEKIRATAIKCRYCGEWLEVPPAEVAPKRSESDADAGPPIALPTDVTPQGSVHIDQASAETASPVGASLTEAQPPHDDERYMPPEMRKEQEDRSSVTDYLEQELEKTANRQYKGSSEAIPPVPDGALSQQTEPSPGLPAMPKRDKSPATGVHIWLLSIGIVATCIGRLFELHNPEAYTAGGKIGFFLGVLIGYSFILGIVAMIVAALRRNVRRYWFPTFAWLFLLVGLFDIGVKAYLEFILRPQVDARVRTLAENGKLPPPAAKDDATSNTEERAAALSQALGRVSQKDIRKELVEKIGVVPILYTSPDDGFSVTFPKQPTFTEVDMIEVHTHNYQAYSADESVSYNVFFNVNEKKILASDSQEAFLKNHLVGRLALLTKPQVLRDNPTTHNGLLGREYAYIEAGTDPPILFRGLVFLLDGDAVSLSMLHAKNVVPQCSFEDFVASFQLLPLPANLSDEFWRDAATGLRLRAPSDMKSRKGGDPSTGRIASFSNAAGHSLIIFNVSSRYPTITMSEVQSQCAGIEKDKDGWYRNTSAASASRPRMVQLMKYLQTPSGIYMIQGYGPESSFFRSETKIKEATRTLVLPGQ